MNYCQLSIVADVHQQEQLIALLLDFDPTGFEQTETKLIATFKENCLLEKIENAIRGYEYCIETIEDQNWNGIWESNFQPVVVDNFCSIRAHFHSPITSTQYDIIITPKMSFGTGHHATTHMMIHQMNEIDFVDKKVFDFGTGTGVLSILAEKMGANSVHTIDVDEWSIENALENIERNNCSKIEAKLSSSVPNEEFDILLANINKNVILQYLSQLKNAIVKDGYILFSGLLKEDEKDMIEACNKEGFRFLKGTGKDNWICLLFVN